MSSRRFGEGKEKETETDKLENHQLIRDGIQAACALISRDETGEEHEKIERRKVVEMTGLDKSEISKERDDQESKKVDRVVIEEAISKVGMNSERISCLEGNIGIDLEGMQVDEM